MILPPRTTLGNLYDDGNYVQETVAPTVADSKQRQSREFSMWVN